MGPHRRGFPYSIEGRRRDSSRGSGAMPDHLVWPAQARVTLYGVGIGLRVANPDHLAPLLAHMPHGAEPAPPGRLDRMYSVAMPNRGQPIYHLWTGSRRRAQRFDDFERLARAFAADARHVVALRAQHRVFIHAGVVAFGDQVILIPGRTLTGKTTLVAELLRAGATYYSDEYAVLDEAGWVHPFAKALSIRTTVDQPQTLVDVATLGVSSGTVPLRVKAVLSTRYVSGASWRPEPLSAGHAALCLLDNAVAARSRFAEVCRVISAALDGRIRAWQGTRGEARQVARWMVAEFSSPA